jgi:hypothetical protein
MSKMFRCHNVKAKKKLGNSEVYLCVPVSMCTRLYVYSLLLDLRLYVYSLNLDPRLNMYPSLYVYSIDLEPRF